MADFSDIQTTDAYTQLVSDLNDRIEALEQQLSVGTHTGLATGAIRYNPAQQRWEQYNGTAWGPLASQYNVNVQSLQGAEPAVSATNSSIAKRTSTGELRATAPSANNGVVTKQWGDGRYLQGSNNLSDVGNQTTARGNLGLGTASTKNVGTGASQLPQNSDLGSAANVDTGTGANDVPQNSDLGTAAYKNEGAGSGLNADTLDGHDSTYFAPIANPNFTGNVDLNSGGLNISGSTGFGINSMIDLVSVTSNKLNLDNHIVLHNNGTDIGFARLNPDGSINEWLIKMSLATGGVTFPSTKLGLGMTGETWSSVARNPYVNYTNTLGRPIMVSAAGTGNVAVLVDGIVVARDNADSLNWGSAVAVVPPGSVYKVDVEYSLSLVEWVELS